MMKPGKKPMSAGAISVAGTSALAGLEVDPDAVVDTRLRAPRQTRREVALLRAAGVAVTLLVPSAADLAIAGRT